MTSIIPPLWTGRYARIWHTVHSDLRDDRDYYSEQLLDNFEETEFFETRECFSEFLARFLTSPDWVLRALHPPRRPLPHTPNLIRKLHFFCSQLLDFYHQSCFPFSTYNRNTPSSSELYGILKTMFSFTSNFPKKGELLGMLWPVWEELEELLRFDQLPPFVRSHYGSLPTAVMEAETREEPGDQSLGVERREEVSEESLGPEELYEEDSEGSADFYPEPGEEARGDSSEEEVVEKAWFGDFSAGGLAIAERIQKNLQRADNWNVQHPSIVLPSLGQVDRIKLLDHMIFKAKEIHRYEEFFQQVGENEVKKILDSLLPRKIKDLCQSGGIHKQSILNLKEDLGDPASSKDPGVYLHIIYKTDEEIFWLYVGQSICLQDRIKAHNDNRYKSTAFCLHYHMWNESTPNESSFLTVFKAELKDLKTKFTEVQIQLFLNLAEMWLSLLFQTLPQKHLAAYTPDTQDTQDTQDKSILWASRHLNVALPLYQSFKDLGSPETRRQWDEMAAEVGRETFETFLRSPDPEIRQWAKSMRDGFLSLRDSPDEKLRGYFTKQFERFLEAGHRAQEQNVINKWKKVLEEGEEFTVKKSGEIKSGKFYPKFHLTKGAFLFRTHQKLRLEIVEGENVMLKLSLANGCHRHPYALRARMTDPAIRLGVFIERIDPGKPSGWLSVTGLRDVKIINTLVDVLEGYYPHEYRKFPRRAYFTRENDKAVVKFTD